LAGFGGVWRAEAQLACLPSPAGRLAKRGRERRGKAWHPEMGSLGDG
jgi:hypothetical protein